MSENYIKQLHQILLRYSSKDECHRGDYKKDSNRVAAFDADGHEIGSIFETATPFDILMRELVEWANDNFKDGYFHSNDSMESVIEASKEGYYRALRGTQKSINFLEQQKVF